MKNHFLMIADKPEPTAMFKIDMPSIEFIYYDRTKDGVWIYSTEKDGFLIGPLKFWVSAIESAGFDGLIYVDRNLRVNPKKVTSLDQKYAKAFFGPQKECSMSDRGFKLLASYMGQQGLDLDFNIKLRAAHS